MKILNWLRRFFAGHPMYGTVPLNEPEPVAKLDRTAEIVSLRRQLDRTHKAGGFCERHRPNGGARNCIICGIERLSTALSQIAAICEDHPEVTAYDCHCNEKAVVKQVEELRWRMFHMEALLKTVSLDEHRPDEQGPCLCSQCEFRRAVREILK